MDDKGRDLVEKFLKFTIETSNMSTVSHLEAAQAFDMLSTSGPEIRKNAGLGEGGDCDRHAEAVVMRLLVAMAVYCAESALHDISRNMKSVDGSGKYLALDTVREGLDGKVKELVSRYVEGGAHVS